MCANRVQRDAHVCIHLQQVDGSFDKQKLVVKIKSGLKDLLGELARSNLSRIWTTDMHD